MTTMTPSRRRGLLLIGTLALLVLAALLLRGRAAVPPPASAATASATLHLQAADVLAVQQQPLARQVALSGSLRARQSAFVKAKVAGELVALAVREGEAVRAGQVIGQIDATEPALRLAQAEQQAQAARAQLELAERTLANNQAMVGQGFISANALETARLSAEGARASWQAAQSAVALARKAQADARLVAPISGLIAQRLAQPGERVAVDAKVVEIVDLSQIELEAAVAPQDVVQLRPGAQARIQVDGLPEALDARVARISPSASSASRTVNVYLALAPHPALRQGLFAQGRVQVAQRQALAVPSDALRLDQPTPALLVLEGGQVHRREVRTGQTGLLPDGSAATEILDGVPEGAQVLAASVGLVRDGTPVQWTRP